MAFVIKGILLALCALVVFARNSFPSNTLYWLTYVVMFALVPLWWLAEYWVTEKKAKSLVKEEILKSFFASMPPVDTRDDFVRGRLCITKENLFLVIKEKGTTKIIWQESKKNITSVGLCKVASKNGFIIYTKKSEFSFASKHAEELQKAILEI